jgi:uncharacterized iron-regulated membrane protein
MPTPAHPVKPKNRWLVKFRQWHTWGGLAAGLFLLIVGATGVVLNYKKPIFTALGLERADEKRGHAAKSALSGAAHAFTTATGFAAAGVSSERALALAREEWGDVPLERIELKHEHGGLVWKIKNRHGAELLVNATTGTSVLKGDYEKLGPPGPDGQPVKSFDWGKLLLHLHTGQIGGEVGKALMSLAALLLLFLTGSGIYLWLKPLLIRRQNAKARAAAPAPHHAPAAKPAPQPARELVEV